MALDEVNRRVVLFGGRSPVALSDTWSWDPATQRWTDVSPRGGPTPPARYGAAMAFDGARIVLFGGVTGTGTVLGDTWTWDGASWAEVTMPATAARPRPRAGAAMAFDRRRGRVVLFGGTEFRTEMGDTWLWDGARRQWAPGPSAGPPGRTDVAMAYDDARNVVLLFGGYDGRCNMGDTWTWDGAWAPATALPPTCAAQPSAVPPNLRGATMAFDAGTRRLVMFGGYGDAPTDVGQNQGGGGFGLFGNNQVDRTFTWDGTAWREESPYLMALPAPPPRRAWAAMAATAAAPSSAGTVMLFGGSEPDAPSGSPGDTWVWDGAPPPLDTTTTGPAPTSTTVSAPPTSTSTTTLALPAVGRLTPASGPTGGGTPVRIDGANLAGAVAVMFGDERLDCTVPPTCDVADDRILVTTPPHERGTVDVRVTAPAGTSPIVRGPAADDRFTFFPPPLIGSGGDGAAAATGGPGSNQPVQPAPPGGFGAAPAPGTGFSPGAGFTPVPGAGIAPATGFSPVPGGIAPATGFSPLPGAGAAGAPAAAPPAVTPTPSPGAGAAPPPPPPAQPGLLTPGAGPPPAPVAAPAPEPGPAAGTATQHHMRLADGGNGGLAADGGNGGLGSDGGNGGLAAAGGGAVLTLLCFGCARRRRPGTGPSPVRRLLPSHSPAAQRA